MQEKCKYAIAYRLITRARMSIFLRTLLLTAMAAAVLGCTTDPDNTMQPADTGSSPGIPAPSPAVALTPATAGGVSPTATPSSALVAATPSPAIGHTTTPTPVPQPARTTVPSAVPPADHLAQILPWLKNPPDSEHRRAGQAIAAAWEDNPETGSTVAKLPWVLDGVSGAEPEAIEVIIHLAAADLELARLVSQWPWVGGDMNGYDISLLSEFQSTIAARDVEVATRIAAHHWLERDATYDDHWLLTRMLTELAKADFEAVDRLSSSSWFTDGMTFSDMTIIDRVVNTAESRQAIISALEEDAETGWSATTLPWVMDGLEGREPEAIEVMARLAAADVELARLVSQWPWVGGDMDRYDIALLSDFQSTIAARDVEVATRIAAHHWLERDATYDDHWLLTSMLTDLAKSDFGAVDKLSSSSWFTDGMTFDDMTIIKRVVNSPETRQTIISALEEDTETGWSVTTLPWVMDGLEGREPEAIEVMARLAAADVELARLVAQWPWVGVGMNGYDIALLSDFQSTIAARDVEVATRIAAHHWLEMDATYDDHWLLTSMLTDLAKSDFEAVKRLSSSSWFTDGMTFDDMSIIKRVVNTPESRQAIISALEEDTETGWSATTLPWVMDGLEGREPEAIEVMARLAAADVELARLVAQWPWMGGDMDRYDISILSDFQSTIGARDVELAKRIAAHHWVETDATEVDHWVFTRTLNQLASLDLETARKLTAFPWFTDGITFDDRILINRIVDTPNSGQMLAMSPWVHDAVTREESKVFTDLLNVAGRDSIAAGIAAEFFRSPIEELDLYVSESLSYLSNTAPEAFRKLVRQPWFADGLERKEAVLVSTLARINRASPEVFDGLIESHHTQSSTISVPLAGEVSIRVIQNSPFPPGDNVLEATEAAVIAIEDFMGAPFPTSEIISLVVVSEPGAATPVGPGKHTGGFNLFSRIGQQQVSPG